MDTPENICKFVMNHGTEEDITMMNKMLQDRRISSPDVRCSEWYNGTALMYQSSFNGTFEAMRFLIDEGVYINITNDLKETALFWAVQCSIETGLREKTILLLREGAKVWGLKDYKGITVIEACDNQKMKAQLQEIANEEFVLNEQEKRDRTERAEAEAKQKQTLVEAESKQKQTLAEAEAKTSSDPDEEKYQKIEMTRFKGGKTKKRRRKRRKTKKHRKSKNNRKPRK